MDNGTVWFYFGLFSVVFVPAMISLHVGFFFGYAIKGSWIEHKLENSARAGIFGLLALILADVGFIMLSIAAVASLLWAWRDG